MNFEQVEKDITMPDLPKDETAWSKIKGDIKNGSRISWYHEMSKADIEDYLIGEELTFESAKESGLIFSGICVPIPDGRYWIGEFIEADEVVVVLDLVPDGDDSIDNDWIYLGRILDYPDVVEMVVE